MSDDKDLLNKKIQDLIDLSSDLSITTSKQGHLINELSEKLKEVSIKFDKFKESYYIESEGLKISVATIKESVNNIKNGMEKVDGRFTWVKIISFIITIITISVGAISTMIIILKNLGIIH